MRSAEFGRVGWAQTRVRSDTERSEARRSRRTSARAARSHRLGAIMKSLRLYTAAKSNGVAVAQSRRSSSSSTRGRPPILPPGAEGAPHGLLLWGGGFINDAERRGGGFIDEAERHGRGSNHRGGAAQCGLRPQRRGHGARRRPPFQEPPSHFFGNMIDNARAVLQSSPRATPFEKRCRGISI
jgi:hypothetical protein